MTPAVVTLAPDEARQLSRLLESLAAWCQDGEDVFDLAPYLNLPQTFDLAVIEAVHAVLDHWAELLHDRLTGTAGPEHGDCCGQAAP